MLSASRSTPPNPGEDTRSEKYTDPCRIHHLLSYHTHTLPNRHNRDSHHLGDRRLRNTPPHILRHAWPCPRGGHTLETPSDISEVHMHTQAHTQTHANSLHTGASTCGNLQIRPCQEGTDTGSSLRHPRCFFHGGSKGRGPCTPRAHRHTRRRHTRPRPAATYT